MLKEVFAEIPKFAEVVSNELQVFIVGGFFSNKSTSEVFEYLEEENILLKHPDMNFPRSGHRCLIVNGHLFTLGGYNTENHEFHKTCEAYELIENKLTYKEAPN